MAGEHQLQEAAEAVHEIIGDRMGFAIVIWVPGKEGLEGAVAYVAHPDHALTCPVALETAATVMRRLEQ